MLINHYGLNVMDPQARSFLKQNMEAFLFKTGGEEDVDTSKKGTIHGERAAWRGARAVALGAALAIARACSAPCATARGPVAAPPPVARAPSSAWADSVLATHVACATRPRSSSGPSSSATTRRRRRRLDAHRRADPRPARRRLHHVRRFADRDRREAQRDAARSARCRCSSAPIYETGAGFRARGGYFLPNDIDLGGATLFPYQMGIGATRDTSLAYEKGRITALEGRALGIHIAFAPVLDVNNNPANPVIGVRSFGEDPHLVADTGRGAHPRHSGARHARHRQSTFPGHGDTDQNSHLELTRVHASRARIDSVELVPFRAAIAAGVRGHDDVPRPHARRSTPRRSRRRSTRAIMTDLLRKQLGFQGHRSSPTRWT